jgi:hypothetical protein
MGVNTAMVIKWWLQYANLTHKIVHHEIFKAPEEVVEYLVNFIDASS